MGRGAGITYISMLPPIIQYQQLSQILLSLSLNKHTRLTESQKCKAGAVACSGHSQGVTTSSLLAQPSLSVQSISRFMALTETPPHLPCQLAPQAPSTCHSVTSPHGHPHSHPIRGPASWEGAQVHMPTLPEKAETPANQLSTPVGELPL